MRATIALSLFTVSLLAACGGGGSDKKQTAATCEELAPRVAQCDPQTTQQDWLSLCSLAILSTDCIQAIAEAPCSEHAQTTPSYQATCFPPCSSTTPSVCSSDQTTVTQCVEQLGGLVTYRCTGVCAQSSTTYTGVCSASYNGQASSSGEPVCWCQ